MHSIHANDEQDLLIARTAVRKAKAVLLRWERRYDRDRSGDALRYVTEIKAAEADYNDAVQALRMLRDGNGHLPEAAEAVSTPRQTTVRTSRFRLPGACGSDRS